MALYNKNFSWLNSEADNSWISVKPIFGVDWLRSVKRQDTCIVGHLYQNNEDTGLFASMNLINSCLEHFKTLPNSHQNYIVGISSNVRYLKGIWTIRIWILEDCYLTVSIIWNSSSLPNRMDKNYLKGLIYFSYHASR